MEETLEIRTHAGLRGPPLVYLPGLHGDWTLVPAFRAALAGRVPFVEITYPRTLSWTLADYAREIDAALAARGLESGWLLAESFGSQVAWAMLAQPTRRFRAEGVVFAGGFVRYWNAGLVRGTRRLLNGVSAQSLQRSLRRYAWLVRHLRYRRSPGRPDLNEFLARRTPLDKDAAAHRLTLIADADWRGVAAVTELPVFHLTGFFDPVVPWWPVRRWLRRHCPGYRGARLVFASDHNVLGWAARAAADQVVAWMAQSHAGGS